VAKAFHWGDSPGASEAVTEFLNERSLNAALRGVVPDSAALEAVTELNNRGKINVNGKGVPLVPEGAGLEMEPGEHAIK
jgi:uncharacterized protein (DUF2141 family)